MGTFTYQCGVAVCSVKQSQNIYMKSRFRIRKFTLARLILLSLGLMNTFAAFSKSKDVTFLVNGVSCQLEQGVLKVEFVTSDIVRVQYTGGKCI